MKKIISCIALLICLAGALTAEAYVEETKEQDLRIELDLTGYINSDLLANGVGVDEQFKISTFENHVGLLLGCRENVDLVIGNDSILPFFNWTPYVGIDLWNVDIICGFGLSSIIVNPENGFGVTYIHVGYNFDIIKPNSNPVSNSLSLKLGITWYPCLPLYCSEENVTGGAVAAAFTAVCPRLEFGVTYRLGHEFILN